MTACVVICYSKATGWQIRNQLCHQPEMGNKKYFCGYKDSQKGKEMNSINIKGRLVRDPELRTVQSDLKIVTFTVAVDRKYAKEKKADFFDCKAFRRQAEVINEYFSKGKEILISGRMESNKWVDKNGATRIGWEVVVEDFEFCGTKAQNSTAPAEAYAPAAGDENPFDDKPPFEMDGDPLDDLPM